MMKKEEKKIQLTKQELEQVVGGLNANYADVAGNPKDSVTEMKMGGMEPGYQTVPQSGGNGGYFPVFGKPGQFHEFLQPPNQQNKG